MKQNHLPMLIFLNTGGAVNRFSFMKFGLFITFFILLLSLTASISTLRADDQTHKWGDWPKWGDQGDGTYNNPVIPSDYSDIDCIRVGSDYYAVSSTFQFSPGVVILHSKDLVNWSILGHVVPDIGVIGPDMTWAKMNRYGNGIWAGAIRYHDNKFWVYFCTPDEGYFMSTATDPAGPWEPLHKMASFNGGWDDCCPFWDDDGQGYFVGTNFREGYKIHLWKLTPDGRDVVPESDQVIHQSSGSEANKLYKFNGTYYHFFSEDRGGDGRVVMMERSKTIFGPYTEEKQLTHGDRDAKEPNQGGIVQTEKGDWYFFTQHGSGDWEGRCDSLVPVTWIDGWPIIGEPDKDNIGHFVWSGKMPVDGTPIITPQTSDEFDETSLPPQWEWNYQPRDEKWSLTDHPGWLRLSAFKPLEPNNLMKAGNTLTQRCFRTSSNEVVIKLDLSGMADGQKAGLCHFAGSHSNLGISQEGATRTIEYDNNGKVTAGPEITGTDLWIRSTWGLDGKSQYSYSLDGQAFTDFGDPYQLTWGNYRGDRIGIYSYNNKTADGYIDVDFFHYKYAGPQDK
jgi:beta-xylosidase